LKVNGHSERTVGSVTDRQPVISVRGEAQLEAEPEIAVVSVTVQARDRDRRTVLERLVARNKQVLDLAAGYGDAVEKTESGPASAYPELKKGDSERVSRYSGQASVRLTVRDFTVLGELVSRLATLELASVAGPWWSLRPDSPVYRQVRIAAAREATLRAREYAEAFGGRLGELIEAADTGLLSSQASQQQGGWHPQAAFASLRGGPAQEEPSLDLEPVRQTVSAQVEARFAMVTPAPPA
jgi:uncharacterized protein YggE